MNMLSKKLDDIFKKLFQLVEFKPGDKFKLVK